MAHGAGGLCDDAGRRRRRARRRARPQRARSGTDPAGPDAGAGHRGHAGPAAAPAPRPDALAREVALLDQARLAAADPPRALELLAEHAREFPGGALADAREAARIGALCRQGQVEAAEAAARELLAGYPASSIARRHENYRCAR
ncbi:hypothetical protein [Nannocystis pusilla]|uniref:hypothetical protein n=1 Tax=Nannocystis pusilla TaxID=889268 RepID=UPI003B7B8E37